LRNPETRNHLPCRDAWGSQTAPAFRVPSQSSIKPWPGTADSNAAFTKQNAASLNTNQGLVPIQESYGGDVSEPLGELTKHPLLGLLELYKSSVELLD